MANVVASVFLPFFVTFWVLQALLADNSVYNKDGLLHVGNSFLTGWSKYSLADETLSPVLSKVVVDYVSGEVFIEKQLYCTLIKRFSSVKVRSFTRTYFRKYIEMRRSVPLFTNYPDLKCTDNLASNGTNFANHSISTVLILPKSMIIDKAYLDISQILNDFHTKIDAASFNLKVGYCNRPLYSTGISLLLDWRFVAFLRDCWPTDPVLVQIQAVSPDGVVEERDIAIYIKSGQPEARNHIRLRRALPTFPRPSYSVSIPENTPVGKNIITLTVEPSSFPGLDITYAISPSSIGFDIDPKTGAVSVSKSPDYEKMQDKKYYALFVRTSFDSTRLVVNIEDVNDNPPKFEQKTYLRTVPEDISSSASILEVKATDEDSGSNGEVTYSLKNPGGINSVFEVDSYSGQIFLRNSRLDRETSSRYELIVTAEDNGTPKRSADAKVIITVSDVNDNSPIFDSPEYTKTISESVAPGSTLLQVTATDKDEGTNKKLSYRIYNDFSNPVVSKFDIKRETGEITLKQKLDYENPLERSVRITVEASDAGIPPKKGTTFVSIYVQDYNDNAPIFRHGCIEYVKESAKIGDIVCTVSASDRDESIPNNEVVYSLAQAPNGLPFIVDSGTGQIRVSGPLDYDDPSKRKFEFTIIATDRGVPSKSTSTIARITLKNVNDNYPSFSKPHYVASIPETTQPGSPILQLSASDVDQPDSVDFQFSIVDGNLKNCFSISSGTIYVQCNLNYDTEKLFNLTVQVKDSGQLGQQLSSTTYVLVNIDDANTHAPSFVKPPDVSSIPEDAGIGSLVLTVSARDLDSGENGRVSYSLVNSDGFFKINPVTGEIRTSKELDSETRLKHDLTVMARDHGTPPRSSLLTLTIAVADVNDNAPKFQKPRYEKKVKEDVNIGSAILRVRALDADAGQNNRAIVYRIPKEHDGDGTFYVQTDGIYGTVRTKKKLDREMIGFYNLIIQAFDKGNPPLNSSVPIKIEVEDVMDSPPVFEKKEYNVTLKEDYPSNVAFLRVKAKSDDLNTDKEIFYQISRGPVGSNFMIEGSSGQISLRPGQTFDYEKKREYTFDVIAYYGQTVFTAATVINIKLIDLNDNPPSLRPFEVFLNYFEDKLPKNPGFKIPAEDKDVSDVLTYQIVGGNGKDFVSLNRTTGNLTFNQNTVNLGSEVSIRVKVSDGLFEKESQGFITATAITSTMVKNTVRLVLRNMTQESFLNSRTINLFKEAFADAVGCSRRLVFIIGVENTKAFLEQDKSPRVQVSVAARATTGGLFLSPKHIMDSLYLKKAKFTKTLGKELLTFDDGNELWCSQESCPNFMHCSMVVSYQRAKSPRRQSTDTVIFWGITPNTKLSCKCPVGFRDLVKSKHRHECAARYSLCFSNPCGNNGVCISTDGDYTCRCKSGYTGKTCEISLKQKSCPKDSFKICKNKGLCAVDSTAETLKCICPGKNVAMTPKCELTTRYFPAKSYASFPGLTNRWKLHLSMEFATDAANAVLFYNGRYSEMRDFIAVRIANGQAELVFSLGESPVYVKSYVDGGVSTGEWQKVSIMFDNKVGRIAVGKNCDIEIGSLANTGATMRYCAAAKTSTKGTFKSLDLNAPFFIGGYPAENMMQLPQWDYVGCIRNLYIDHVLVDLASELKENGTQQGCPVKKDYCTNSPCNNGGKCENLFAGFRCVCADGFIGKSCETDIKMKSGPVRFGTGSIITFKGDVYTLRAQPASFTTELNIKSRQTEAVLMHQLIDGLDAYLKIVGGSLAYFYQSKEMANLSSALVSDGKWHHIKVKLDSKRIQLSQDYERHHVTQIHQASFESKPMKILSVGGVRQSNKISQGFLGCLQGLILNGVYIKTQGVNLKPGCQSVSGCGNCGTGSCSKEWDGEKCHCPKGFTGPNCIDVCGLNPCLNEGLCKRSSTAIHGFTCSCKPSFTGSRCETKISTECVDGYFKLPGKYECGPCNCDIGRSFHPACNKTSGVCFCKSGYFLQSQTCEKCNCLAEGSFDGECDRMTGQCRCKPRVIGLDCDRCIGSFEDISRDCLEINTSCPKSYSDKIWWNQIELGNTRVENCPTGTVGMAKRFCHRRKSWFKADLSSCMTLEFLVANKTLSELSSKSKNMTKQLASSLAKSLEFALTTGKTLYERDIRIGYDGLSRIIEFEGRQKRFDLTSSTDGKFVENVMTSASRLTSLDSKHIWDRIQQGEPGSVGLMQNLEKLLMILARNFAYVRRRAKRAVTTLPPFSLASKNILMEIQQFNTMDSSSYNFPMLRQQWDGNYAQWKDSLPEIAIPPSIFDNTNLANKEVSVGLLVYKALGELLPSIFNRNGRRYKAQLYTDVVSMTIPGLGNETLGSNMTINFINKKNNESTDLSCVFWDYKSSLSKLGGWSTRGCSLVPSNGSTITCQCDHLTSFAAVRFVELLPAKRSAFKIKPVTYITVSVSMALLLFAFLSYLCLSQLRTNDFSIHKNLCAALILAELVFIVGINRTADAIVCRIIAILLHYFFSCVFSWMLVEAFHVYRMLVEARDINNEEMTFYYFIGWGSPVIVVGVTAGLSPQGYGNEQFCWISTTGQLLWTFTAPIMAMVAANFLLFIMSVFATMSQRFKVKKNLRSGERTIARVSRCGILKSVLLLPLLCGTFVIGLLSVNVKMETFSLLFSAFVIVQGLYIVLFYVLFNREVRKEYKNAYIRWKTGDKHYGKKKPRVKRTLVVNSSYRNQLQQLTATFNLSTSTTDSSTDGGRVFGRRRKGERDLASSTQPDSSDSSDEDISKDPDTVPSDSSETSDDDMPVVPPQLSQKRQGSGVTSPNSTRSSNSNSAKSPSGARSPVNGKSASGARSPPTNAARTPEFKLANQKKLRAAPLYASDGPMHSTPSDNSDNSEKRNRRWQADDNNPDMDITDVTVLNEETDGPEDPLLSSLKRQRAEQSSSSDTSEVSSLPSVIRVGPGGKPQSILKKKSKYGNVTDSDSERRGKVRVRISDKSKRPLLNLDRDASEFQDSQV